MPSHSTPSERFWPKVNKTKGCWLWTGCHNSSGYGTFWLEGRRMVAHRWPFESINGPVPKGLELDHLCRVRACVRPSHLEAVSHRTNIIRGASNELAKTHCPQGHPYSGANLVTRRGQNGRLKRTCRSCGRRRSLLYWRKTHQKEAQHA